MPYKPQSSGYHPLPPIPDSAAGPADPVIGESYEAILNRELRASIDRRDQQIGALEAQVAFLDEERADLAAALADSRKRVAAIRRAPTGQAPPVMQQIRESVRRSMRESTDTRLAAERRVIDCAIRWLEPDDPDGAIDELEHAVEDLLEVRRGP